MTTEAFRCGHAAIIGRPNAGKSTLLNRLVGQKISITSDRPQTTRHRMLGIHTTDAAQVIYVDTPGLHRQEGGSLSRIMNRAARTSLEGVDVVLLVVTAEGWRDEDDHVLQLVQRAACPVILVINKIDKLERRAEVLQCIVTMRDKMEFAEIVPVSAKSGQNVPELETAILRHLPEAPPEYDPDQITDRNERFLAAEFVREQVFRSFGQEIPYAVAVEVCEFREEPKHLHIEAILWVEKEGQKGILIGAGGARLKEIGKRARLNMQKTFGRKVWLGLWVKVREGWAEDARALKILGYGEES